MISFQQILRFCFFLLICGVGGCMVGPKYQTPVVTSEVLPHTFKENPRRFKNKNIKWKVAQPQDAMLHGQWWKIFKDAELNHLEDQLNINDQNIKQYFQNFLEARALIGEASAQFYPTIGANASYTRSRSSRYGGSSINEATSSIPGITNSISPISIIISQLDASWEPDLWGKVRYAVQSAKYTAQLSAADLENERLSEQASLASYYFQIQGQDALQKLYNDTIVEYKKALDFTRAQYETGITDQIAVVEAANTLQNAQATAINIEIARAQYEHAIAVLVGRVASNFTIPVKILKATPPSIPLGIPSQLIERRPDVAAAERTMAVNNAQIGIAYTAYFPTITLSAQRGFQSSLLSNLLDPANRTWSYGPTGTETLFEGGLRGATVRQYIATYNSSVAAYRQTVLAAFQQVEDSLAQVRILSEQLVFQRQAEESAKTYVRLAMQRYQTGIDPYLNVITAQNALLTDQQAVINIRIQEMTGVVQLIKALGGGWDKSQLPTPAEVSKRPMREETRIQH